MKLKCISTKPVFKNLTVDKDYDATEENDVYIVTNDAGLRSRYAKGYFREVPVTRNLLDELSVTVLEGRISITLNRTERSIGYNFAQTLNSCGIYEFEGIATLKRVVNEMYANKVPSITGSKSEMFKFIMDELMASLREENDFMCITISDQIRTTDDVLNAVLTEMAESCVTGTNPNSNNEIALWIIK